MKLPVTRWGHAISFKKILGRRRIWVSERKKALAVIYAYTLYLMTG
jgi:hypothetical protein